ncbi:MAG: helix-turn-helix domain-containing protein [Pseudomonadota bacterium]|nr:helix-turn-helix domain-containing protein [Pseudomonadota bacterium]
MYAAPRLFHALGDPTRLLVIQRLARESASVSALASEHTMALSSFLQHVRVLEESGWIRTVKVGRVRTCHLNPAALATTSRFLDEQRGVWERRLDRLDDYLLTMDDDA